MPEDFTIIECCFAEVWSRARYCLDTFGVNEDGYLFGNNKGELFKAAMLNILSERGPISYIKVEKSEDSIKYRQVPVYN